MALMTQVGLEFIARNRAAAEMNHFRQQVQTVSKTLLAFAGLGGGIYAVQRGFRAITEAYMVQERAERDLMAAIRLTDAEYKTTLATLKIYAAELQRQTIYGDEAILSQMAYAKNLGVVTEQLDDAAKAAIGLAAKYRIDLSSAMMLIGRASQGQTQMLTRYGIVLDESLTTQEKFNELLRLGAEAFGLAQEEAKSLEGQMSQLKNAWSDFLETAGKGFQITDALVALTNAIRGLTPVLEKFLWVLGRQVPGAALRDYMNQAAARAESALPTIAKQVEQDRQAAGAAAPTVTAEIPPLITDLLGTKEWQENMAAMWESYYQRVIDETQRAMEEIRNQEYLTRQERIAALEAYREANAETLGDVAEANRIVNEEIMALERARLDAMRLYYTELREDMQDYTLYVKEHFADVARSIENSMASAFESVITEARTWKEAMNQFFADVARAFARMAAEMAARAAMFGLFSMFGGGGGIFGGNITAGVAHEGGMIGDIATRRTVPISTFIGAPSYHGLASDEAAVIAKRGEIISRPGSQQPPVQIGTYIEKVDATDAASFDAQLYRSRHTVADLNFMAEKSNHPKRRGK